MKVFKKIGLGIISLGLISTFYIPEAKASQTLVKFDVNGAQYAIKLKTNGQLLIKEVGSGNQQCKMYVNNYASANAFKQCVIGKFGGSSEYYVDQALKIIF